MMDEMGLDQPGFAAISGTTKSVVNQWLTGKIKTIAPVYAYNIAKKSIYMPEWIMLGSGDVTHDKKNQPKSPSTVTLRPKSPRDKLLEELAGYTDQMNEIGIAKLLGEAKVFTTIHPRAPAETAKSSQ